MVERFRGNFAKNYQLLDSSQRKVVDNIDGPMMVIAGPGSGKTQVIAMRIAQILRKSQVRAQNILALTFTQAGVVSLKERLEGIIGRDGALVNVATFHSFANDLVNNYSFYLSPKPLRMISDLEKFQIIQSLLQDNSKLKNIRPPRSPDFHSEKIIRAISIAKQESITPSTLRKLADQQYHQESQRESQKPKLILAQTKFNRLKELAIIFTQYQKELKKRGLYDYEDVILLAIKALKTNKYLKAIYQEKYQYILVDEYQDTNRSQNELVETLVDFFDHPNLLVVGDDKQAIYRFQGASVANMLNIKKRFTAMEIATINNNYRSAKEIVNLSDKFISANHHQLKNYFSLINTNQKAVVKSKAQIIAYAFENDFTHYRWLSQEIKEIISQNPQNNYTIALLCRNNNRVQEINSYLNKQEIITATNLTENLINTRLVESLCCLLFMIETKQIDKEKIAYVINLLTKDFAVKDYLELAEIEKINSRSYTKLRSSAVVNILERINHYHNRSKRLEFLTCLEEVLSDVVVNLDNQDASRDLDIIEAFWREAIVYNQNYPQATLLGFTQYLELLKRYNLKIEIGRNTQDQSNVYVGTVHSAKGKEYDCVFISDLDDANWKIKQTRDFIELPGSISGIREWQEDAIEDERRLLYVAITRAKSKLYLSCHSQQADGRMLNPSPLLTELAQWVAMKEQKSTAQDYQASIKQFFQPYNSIVKKEEDRQLLKSKFQELFLSYSSYSAYKKCPRQFLMRYLLNFEEKPDITLTYGNIIHKALELYFRKYINERTKPSCDYLIKCYQKLLKSLSPERANEAIFQNGKSILLKYCQVKSASWPIPLAVELSFSKRNVCLGKIKLTGKIDRVEVIDSSADRLRFIDYKTAAKVKSRTFIEGKNEQSELSFKDQLVFYAMLAKNDPQFIGKPEEFMISFIDDHMKFKDESFSVSNQEIKDLEADIINIHEEIIKRIETNDFPHTRENRYDQGCQFCRLFD